jgi:hypothetical protein
MFQRNIHVYNFSVEEARNHHEAGTVLPKRRLTFAELTLRYIPEDRTLLSHRCENLKSNIAISLMHEIYLNNCIQIQILVHTLCLWGVWTSGL